MSELLLTPEITRIEAEDSLFRLTMGDESLPQSPSRPIRGIEQVLDEKAHHNADPNTSNVLLDPCEIDLNLVKETCAFKRDDESACAWGIVLKEGIPHCPIIEARQVTTRSTFASREGTVGVK